ncbi:MAG: cytochrome c [Anaerolineales bacterium]|nr:cytochrome c [Anaerolineales bacterium]
MLTKPRFIFLFAALMGLAIVLTACQPAAPSSSETSTTTDQTSTTGGGMGMGMGNNGMMTRHSAPIPAEYASLTDPVPADEDSLARGEEIFTTHCIVCHGESGMGDGPSAINLDPAPAPIAHTSQMMSDAYLFWRITEGGVPFGTAMIQFGGVLDEQARWDVINYVRALGSGQIAGVSMGNMQSEAEQRATMLTQAVDQGVVTQEEAAVFETVHSAIDALMMGETQGMGMHGMGGGNGQDMGGGVAMNGNVTEMLAYLVETGAITQAQSDAFTDIHTRLENAGLMQ